MGRNIEQRAFVSATRRLRPTKAAVCCTVVLVFCVARVYVSLRTHGRSS